MSDDGARGEERLRSMVLGARARLARVEGRAHLRRKAWWVLAAGGVSAVTRPLLWRLPTDAPLWLGPGRSLLLFIVGSAAATVILILLGRRRRPSEIGAARAVDAAVGTTEVIASGFSFTREDRRGAVAMIARRRAAREAERVEVTALFPLPSLLPRARSALLFALGSLAAVSLGGYERGIAGALLSPPTPRENAAAAALEAAATEIAEQAKESKKVDAPAPERAAPGKEKSGDKHGAAGPAVADKAREAARAARRGDRRGALDKLAELRAAGAERSASAGDLKATLRKMAEALAPSPGAAKPGAAGAVKPASPSADAAESMRLLAEKVRSPEGAAGGGSEPAERVLERIERAAEEARRGGGEGRSRDASEAARALSRAAESLKRGDREAASQALSQAAARAAAMERAREVVAREAMMIAEVLDKSGALERAVMLAMLGGEALMEGEGGDGPGQGEGKGQGQAQGEGQGAGGEGGKGAGRAAALRRAIMARLAAMGAAESSEGRESPGSGPHQPDRQRGKHAPLAAQGSIRAPSQVGEGPRAIQAIRGLGRGSEPPAAYREVFPTYDAAVEEGLSDERIPAERRAAVRKYFQSIRPDQGR